MQKFKPLISTKNPITNFTQKYIHFIAVFDMRLKLVHAFDQCPRLTYQQQNLWRCREHRTLSDRDNIYVYSISQKNERKHALNPSPRI